MEEPNDDRLLARQRMTLLAPRRPNNPHPGSEGWRSTALAKGERFTTLPPRCGGTGAGDTALPVGVSREAARLADELAALIAVVNIGQQRSLMAAFITRLIEATPRK